jgi:ABC-type transport system substrate-binding protein
VGGRRGCRGDAGGCSGAARPAAGGAGWRKSGRARRRPSPRAWGAGTLDSLEVFLISIRSGGVDNWSGYANPRLDQLIEELRSASLTYARDAIIEEVWRIVLDDVVFLPLHHQVLVWAMRENLDLPISPFNTPVFREARLKAVPW